MPSEFVHVSTAFGKKLFHQQQSAFSRLVDWIKSSVTTVSFNPESQNVCSSSYYNSSLNKSQTLWHCMEKLGFLHSTNNHITFPTALTMVRLSLISIYHCILYLIAANLSQMLRSSKNEHLRIQCVQWIIGNKHVCGVFNSSRFVKYGVQGKVSLYAHLLLMKCESIHIARISFNYSLGSTLNACSGTRGAANFVGSSLIQSSEKGSEFIMINLKHIPSHQRNNPYLRHIFVMDCVLIYFLL